MYSYLHPSVKIAGRCIKRYLQLLPDASEKFLLHLVVEIVVYVFVCMAVRFLHSQQDTEGDMLY